MQELDAVKRHQEFPRPTMLHGNKLNHTVKRKRPMPTHMVNTFAASQMELPLHQTSVAHRTIKKSSRIDEDVRVGVRHESSVTLLGKKAKLTRVLIRLNSFIPSLV